MYVIVLGWYNDSFTGVEQELAYTLQIGYQKGAAQLGQNLVFTVKVVPNQAGKKYTFHTDIYE